MQEKIKVKVYVELIFYPTENQNKLFNIIQNIIDVKEENIKIKKNGKFPKIYAVAEGKNGIEKLYEGFRKQKTVQSARSQLFNRINGNSVEFMIHKQAAFMKKFHFCHSEDESPMGPVWIRIESNNIEKLLNYLVPETKQGKVLEMKTPLFLI
ncbi:MAG: RNA-binding domain-containing protein [Promethearchaeota archaeon]